MRWREYNSILRISILHFIISSRNRRKRVQRNNPRCNSGIWYGESSTCNHTAGQVVICLININGYCVGCFNLIRDLKVKNLKCPYRPYSCSCLNLICTSTCIYPEYLSSKAYIGRTEGKWTCSIIVIEES